MNYIAVELLFLFIVEVTCYFAYIDIWLSLLYAVFQGTLPDWIIKKDTGHLQGSVPIIELGIPMWYILLFDLEIINGNVH